MTRQEENEMLITEITKNAKDSGRYEEIVTMQFGIIASILADISKSLAIMADKEDKE